MKVLQFILLLCITSFSFGQEKDNIQVSKSIKQKLEHFSKITDTILQKGKTPGAAIAIVYDNKLVFKKTYGYRDIENRLPVTPQTLFDIASLTKAMTGTITSQLVAEDKLKWNDKVVKHIPEFNLVDNYAAQNATIKDLLTHRVGVEQHFYLMYGPKYSRNEVLDKLQYLNFKGSFRENFLYNNFMYTVVGMLQERITQQPWETLIQERIFKPLDMTHTIVDLKAFASYKDKAISYQNDGKTVIPMFSYEAYAPAGTMTFSTLDDMTKWISILANSGIVNEKEFLPKAQFEYITKPHTVRYPDISVFYGIGWNIDKDRNAIYHRGSSAGQNSSILFQPEKGFAIIILTNQSSLVPYLLEIYASNIFLNDDFNRNNDHESYIVSSANKSAKSVESYTIEDVSILHQLENFVGRYKHPVYGTIKIDNIQQNMFSFKYYDFKGTIKHNEGLDFSAHVTYFQGTDTFNFRVLKNKDKSIKGIEVNFPYSEPLIFEKE